MKIHLIIVLVSSLIIFSCSDGEYNIYLSPNGDDNATGSLTDPIASLQKALKTP